MSQSKDSSPSKEDTLDTLFPSKAVPLPDGSVVTVSPLSLEDLPKVIGAFSALMDKVEAKAPPTEIALECMAELLKLLPFCLDRPPSEVPVLCLPEVLLVVIGQNMTEDALGKWKALIEKFTDLAPLGQSLSELASSETSRKE